MKPQTINTFSAISFLFLIIASPYKSKNLKICLPGNNQTYSSDTISKFAADDYPVTNEMFAPNLHPRKSGEIFEDEGAWFSNDTLKQTLVFVLYTDYHRLVTYHFLNNDIPLGIIQSMELHTAGGDLASDKLKQKYFKGFLTQTTKIVRSYFKTSKGFKLGDSKEKALKVYGKPDKTKIENGIEKHEWDFVGDFSYDSKTKLKRNILAEDSFGHQITMFFRNNKLIGIIFHNDIP
ncbi:MAG TPA: hypothetical protein VGQ04_12170 [Chitinophagaceae bacterium]|jgi:hypothetical protein|nr:hypothetical protein [Chitinophagaceae bacterium]